MSATGSVLGYALSSTDETQDWGSSQHYAFHDSVTQLTPGPVPPESILPSQAGSGPADSLREGRQPGQLLCGFRSTKCFFLDMWKLSYSCRLGAPPAQPLEDTEPTTQLQDDQRGHVEMEERQPVSESASLTCITCRRSASASSPVPQAK